MLPSRVLLTSEKLGALLSCLLVAAEQQLPPSGKSPHVLQPAAVCYNTEPSCSCSLSSEGRHSSLICIDPVFTDLTSPMMEIHAIILHNLAHSHNSLWCG